MKMSRNGSTDLAFIMSHGPYRHMKGSGMARTLMNIWMAGSRKKSKQLKINSTHWKNYVRKKGKQGLKIT